MDLATVVLISFALMIVSAIWFLALTTDDQKVYIEDYDKGVEGAAEQFNQSLSFTQDALLRVVLISLIVTICTGAVMVADMIAGVL